MSRALRWWLTEYVHAIGVIESEDQHCYGKRPNVFELLCEQNEIFEVLMAGQSST